ncbi:MAG: hydrogenase nickel incorporation protein HypB [Gallionella sp.]
MCTTCGCGAGQTLIGGHALKQRKQASGQMQYRTPDHSAHEHVHVHTHGEQARSPHPNPLPQAGEGANARNNSLIPAIDFGTGPAGAHAPGMTQARMVKIERDILSKNDGYANENRGYLAAHGIFALNLVSSPGSGKTTLLVKSISALNSSVPLAVIEGDQQTDNDAARIRATGASALQINTGKGCHLDAHMVGQAMQQLGLQDDSLLLIENVGNLVCPASFDLGEAHKVAILSVTEGEDKPLKYPDMFRASDLMLLNKCDLLPYLTFDANLAIENARRVNPNIQVIRISATSGEGMEEWLTWIKAGCQKAVAGRMGGA